MVEDGPTTPTVTSDFPTRRSTNQNASSADDVITARRHYVGYIPDLLRALAALLDFRYELYPVPDGSYGYRKTSREWSGLVGELVAEVNCDNRCKTCFGPTFLFQKEKFLFSTTR